MAVIIFLYRRNTKGQDALIEAKNAHLKDIKEANDRTDKIKEIIVPLVLSIDSMKVILEILRDRAKQ